MRRVSAQGITFCSLKPLNPGLCGPVILSKRSRKYTGRKGVRGSLRGPLQVYNLDKKGMHEPSYETGIQLHGKNWDGRN